MQSICVTNHKLIISAFWLQIYDYYFIFQNFLLFFCQFTNKKGPRTCPPDHSVNTHNRDYEPVTDTLFFEGIDAQVISLFTFEAKIASLTSPSL